MSSQPPENDQNPWSSGFHEDDATRFVSGEDSDAHDEIDVHALELDIEENCLIETEGLVGVVGEYLLLDQIGAGGMGQVFRAEHRTMNREVALKVLSREIADQPPILQQFFAEIRAVAKLMHPNIVTAFDAGSAGSIHYLVMELVDGGVLSSKVRQFGAFPADEAVNILVQVAEALAYAHDQGIVHRDIKPGNIMLSTSGVVKILDFGLARLGTTTLNAGNKRFFMGTPEYMSPEQIENADEVDGRSDLYSLGATLFYLLTGETMFTGEKMQVARAHLHEKPKPLFEVRADLDLRLDSVFQRLVAKDPADRYANAHELLEALDRLNLTANFTAGSPLHKGAYRLAKESPTSAGFGVSTLAKKSQIVGIDFGLLTSSAAYYDANLGPQLIAQGDGTSPYLRNMIWSSGKDIRIGSEASALRQVDPNRIFHSTQRWIGQTEIQRSFGGKTVPPEVVLASLIRQIMQNSASATDNSSSAVVTIPSCYGQMHRRSIRNACEIAGVEPIQLLDKSLAAAITWLDLKCRLSEAGRTKIAADDKLLVVQLSGTGLDASVVHAYGATAKQLGTCGHWKLGQGRWQHLLVQYFSAVLLEKTGKSIREDVAAATRLQRTIEIAMRQLTQTNKVEVRFDWLGASIQQVVTQEGLIKIAPDLTLSIQQSIATACAIANTDLSEIDHCLLAGSMMMMKPVQRIVTDVIPHDVDITFVDKADLARGAAIQANHLATLSSKSDALMPQAVASTAYDIALLADSPDRVQKQPKVLVEKGKPIPTSHSRTIRPKVVDGCNSGLPTLQLIESSSLGEGNWLKLGKIKPIDAFPLKRPEDALQLRLEVDQSGILDSSVVLPATNQQVSVPSSSDPELSDSDKSHWREWLETTLLCSR